MARWQVKGADRNTGRTRIETYEAHTGREAQEVARADGILTQEVTPLHDDIGPPSGHATPPSVLSKADWRKLEWTITKGVCGGVILLFVLQAIVVLACYLAVTAMRG